MSLIAPILQSFFTERLAKQRQASTHRRLLPRHPAAPAGLHAATHRQAALAARLGGPRRGRHMRLPRPLGSRPSQQPPDPQRPPDRDPLPVRLRRPSPPRARRADRPSAGDTTEAFRQGDGVVLSPPEVDALLAAPDRTRWEGRRDHAMLFVAIQTGLRVSKLIGLNCGDVARLTGLCGEDLRLSVYRGAPVVLTFCGLVNRLCDVSPTASQGEIARALLDAIASRPDLLSLRPHGERQSLQVFRDGTQREVRKLPRTSTERP